MKKLLYLIIIVLVAIQFIPVKQENPPVTADFSGPVEVKDIFRTSCYDCHSNETNWEWYHKIAPASWIVARNVKNGREELNFSEWGDLSNKNKRKLRENIWEEVEEGKMPNQLYLMVHKEAKLTEEQKELIEDWSFSLLDEIIDLFSIL